MIWRMQWLDKFANLRKWARPFRMRNRIPDTQGKTNGFLSLIFGGNSAISSKEWANHEIIEINSDFFSSDHPTIVSLLVTDRITAE